MNAHVIYTEINYMEIVVIAEVFNAATGGYDTTNIFYYTYSDSEQIPEVIPKTYHEFMWYLNGRRHFNSAMGFDGNNNVTNISPIVKNKIKKERNCIIS